MWHAKERAMTPTSLRGQLLRATVFTTLVAILLNAVALLIYLSHRTRWRIAGHVVPFCPARPLGQVLGVRRHPHAADRSGCCRGTGSTRDKAVQVLECQLKHMVLLIIDLLDTSRISTASFH